MTSMARKMSMNRSKWLELIIRSNNNKIDKKIDEIILGGGQKRNRPKKKRKKVSNRDDVRTCDVDEEIVKNKEKRLTLVTHTTYMT